MDRRGFLKRAGALAVAGAFPLPNQRVDAALHFAGVPLVFDAPDFILASPDIYAEFEKVWEQVKPQPCEHIFGWPNWFCIACGAAAEDVLNSGVACNQGDKR